MLTDVTIGDPFDVLEVDAIDYLNDLGSDVLLVVNDPPWMGLSGRVTAARQVVQVTSMDYSELEGIAASVDRAVTCVVGVGGGTAIDTAKFISWTSGLPAVFIPTIASVDATFTDAVGIRRDRKVSYIGKVRPREVVIDLDLISSAPARLNRAGIGDILSCHTGIFDWAIANDAGHGVKWDSDLVELGHTLLAELVESLDEIQAGSAIGVAALLDGYRRVGAACAAAGHSRFEEGSEHFLGYAIEEQTGIHFVHGELISMCVVAMSVIQGNDPDFAASLVQGALTSAHPDSVGVTREVFVHNILRLHDYTREEGLDFSIVNRTPVTPGLAEQAWRAVCTLPRAD